MESQAETQRGGEGAALKDRCRRTDECKALTADIWAGRRMDKDSNRDGAVVQKQGLSLFLNPRNLLVTAAERCPPSFGAQAAADGSGAGDCNVSLNL